MLLAVGVHIAELLREPKIGQLQVAVHPDHHVLGLEVAEDDAVRMNMLERERNLSGVDDDPGLTQSPFGLKQVMQVAAAHKVHDQEDILIRLEGEAQRDHIRMRPGCHLLHHLLLGDGLRHARRVAVEQLLSDHLHRVHLLRVDLGRHHDLAKRALAAQAVHLKVVEPHRRVQRRRGPGTTRSQVLGRAQMRRESLQLLSRRARFSRP